jgi:hypothetical protein
MLSARSFREVTVATPPERLSLPDVPIDVLDFALEHDQLVYDLRPVLTVTRTCFPTAPMALRLEHDPEVEGRTCITVAVDCNGRTADHMWEARRRWTPLLLRVCLTDEAALFRLSMGQADGPA